MSATGVAGCVVDGEVMLEISGWEGLDSVRNLSYQ